MPDGPGAVETGMDGEMAVAPDSPAAVRAVDLPDAPDSLVAPAAVARSDSSDAPDSLARQLEALLFVSEEPQSLASLAAATSHPLAEVVAAIDVLVAETSAAGHAFELREVGGGWRYYLRSEFDDFVTTAIFRDREVRLSQAAIETLTVVAYKQPVSRSQVAAVRAVNVDSVMRTLVSRGLIEEVGRDEVTDAILYGTTALMLEHLGINSTADLLPISPLLDSGADGFLSDRG